MIIDNDFTRNIQENIKKMMENEYEIYHTCMINDDKLYFCFQDGKRLDINIEIRLNLRKA